MGTHHLTGKHARGQAVMDEMEKYC